MGDIFDTPDIPAPPKPPRRKPPKAIAEIKSEPLVPDVNASAAATKSASSQRRSVQSLRINRTLPGSGLSIPQ